MKKISLILLTILLGLSITGCTTAFGEPDDGNSTTPDDGNSTTPDDGNGTTPDGGNSTTPDGGNSTTPDDGNGTTPDDGNGTTPDDGNGTTPVIDPLETFFDDFVCDAYLVSSTSIDGTVNFIIEENVIKNVDTNEIQVIEDIRSTSFTLEGEYYLKTTFLELELMYTDYLDLFSMSYEDFTKSDDDNEYLLSSDCDIDVNNLKITYNDEEFTFTFDVQVDDNTMITYYNTYEAANTIDIPTEYELAIGDISFYEDFYKLYAESGNFSTYHSLLHASYHLGGKTTIYHDEDGYYRIEYNDYEYELVGNYNIGGVELDIIELPEKFYHLLNFTQIYSLSEFMYMIENSILDESTNTLVFTCSGYVRKFEQIDTESEANPTLKMHYITENVSSYSTCQKLNEIPENYL